MSSKSLSSDKLEAIQEGLLHWFETFRREFPWRDTFDPYEIIVAEKLLQQTLARQTVVTVYENLLVLYPRPEQLATANLLDLENLIRPLGLLYRARELKAMAQEIVSSYQGAVPRTLEELLSLTGIGQYCARAVLSFAYNEDIAIVDTNVARFLHRLFGIDDPLPANPARKKKLIELAESLLPSGRSKDFNLAILDLCALICKSGQPLCDQCPISRYCSFGTSRL